ncbi:MAG: redox-sensing transcriptional repressor Rex [Candidatus Omnitrophica bacterium]|nr:redox-sensing transcriptional repressor Rex [Candidatus Omnitrophota bacterium]
MAIKQVPPRTISRVLLYIRTLGNLIKDKKDRVSSQELASMTGLTDVQIRKDISAFGRIGSPRIGYRTAELKDTLENFILQKKVVHVALFGVGNLGAALLKYPGFREEKIRIVAAFDIHPSKVGREISGIKVHSVDDAEEVIRRTCAVVGILAVPERESQKVADLMVASGLRGIVNFSPVSITVPPNVRVKNIDLGIEFISLFCETQRVHGSRCV